MLPWSALPAAAVAPPVLAAVAAAFTALLTVHAPSLTAAQQRAALLLVLPPALASGAVWLLPQLSGLGYLSLPHVLFSALRFRPPFAAGPEALLAFMAWSGAAAAALCLSVWLLRRRPPV